MTVGAELVTFAAAAQAFLDLRSGEKFYEHLDRVNRSSGTIPNRMRGWIKRWMPTPQTIVDEMGDLLTATERDMLLTYQSRIYAWAVMTIGAGATWFGAAVTWGEKVGHEVPLITSLATAISALVLPAGFRILNSLQTKKRVGRQLLSPLRQERTTTFAGEPDGPEPSLANSTEREQEASSLTWRTVLCMVLGIILLR